MLPERKVLESRILVRSAAAIVVGIVGILGFRHEFNEGLELEATCPSEEVELARTDQVVVSMVQPEANCAAAAQNERTRDSSIVGGVALLGEASLLISASKSINQWRNSW